NFLPLIFSSCADEEEQRKKKTKTAFNSSTDGNSLGSKPLVLPPPRHSFSLAPPPAFSSARRVVVQGDVPETTTKTSNEATHGQETSYWGLGNQNFDTYEQNSVDGASYPLFTWVPGNESYGYHQGSYRDGSIPTTSDPPVQSVGAAMGNFVKRGKNEVPVYTVEVKQDDLISNRPREDQVKLTGIAFGPAYRPVSSVKGKPSKLHKRKHQIGSLFYDMKQKEMELAERQARGGPEASLQKLRLKQSMGGEWDPQHDQNLELPYRKCLYANAFFLLSNLMSFST
ncbi:uncharacterized protein, partial [Aristolochia californica]|uniref:uncharacterized protein n=1 Tax=Aristolochia californica TaxID=171875 RepID=UPI0035E27E11